MPALGEKKRSRAPAAKKKCQYCNEEIGAQGLPNHLESCFRQSRLRQLGEDRFGKRGLLRDAMKGSGACHITSFEVNLLIASRIWVKNAVELTIQCERSGGGFHRASGKAQPLWYVFPSV